MSPSAAVWLSDGFVIVFHNNGGLWHRQISYTQVPDKQRLQWVDAVYCWFQFFYGICWQ